MDWLTGKNIGTSSSVRNAWFRQGVGGGGSEMSTEDNEDVGVDGMLIFIVVES